MFDIGEIDKIIIFDTFPRNPLFIRVSSAPITEHRKLKMFHGEGSSESQQFRFIYFSSASNDVVSAKIKEFLWLKQEVRIQNRVIYFRRMRNFNRKMAYGSRSWFRCSKNKIEGFGENVKEYADEPKNYRLWRHCTHGWILTSPEIPHFLTHAACVRHRIVTLSLGICQWHVLCGDWMWNCRHWLCPFERAKAILVKSGLKKFSENIYAYTAEQRTY